MGPQRKSLSGRLLALILNIGAEPKDSEYIRLVKRIWYVASVISLPTSLYAAISEYWMGGVFAASGFLFSFFLFLAVLVDGARFPGHSERNSFYILLYFLLGFIFGGMYFFVVQREKAHIQLGLEKEKTESLLRRIEEDLVQTAEIQKRLLPGDNPRFEGFDITGSRDLPAAELHRRVLEDARSFAATGQPCDDITLVVVKRTAAPSPALLK
jgi:hypothetical protein